MIAELPDAVYQAVCDLCREPIPGDRDPQWLASHRFDLETALRLAQELAPKVTVNGLTAPGQAQWEANLKVRTT